MNWAKGFSASYYATLVDPETWFDEGLVKITGGSIKKTVSGLRESATVNTTSVDFDNEVWIRIYLIAKQSVGAGSERVPLFTGLGIPSKSQRGRIIGTTIECFSVLSVIDDVLMPRGWYAPVGTHGVTLIRDLLRQVSKAPVEIADYVDDNNSLRLKASIVAEGGETYLTMIEKILLAINWRLKMGGDGTIEISPMLEEPVIAFDSLSYDIINSDSEISYDYNFKECPNVFRAISNDGFAIARDEKDDSPFSIQNRGREIWNEEQGVVLADKETLSDYAIRRLADLQKISTTIGYSRRFIPGVSPSDLIELNYPAQNLVGLYMVSTQDIELNYGASVSEEVIKI